MTLAQVQAAVAVVAILIVTWSGLLMAVALLIPDHTSRAEQALDNSPRRCFLIGVAMVGAIVLGLVLLNIPNPLVKLAGFLGLLWISGILTLGAAGIARMMGKRTSEISGAKSSFGALVSGTLIYSMAIGFPFVGWFVFAPFSLICALGAGVSALLPNRNSSSLPLKPSSIPGFEMPNG